MRLRRIFSLIILLNLVVHASLTAAMAFVFMEDTAEPVNAELFAAGDLDDGGLLVAVHLTIQPGWHLYWEHPGEAGMPVSVTWRLPEGYRALPLEFPLPGRFEAAGLMGYGYDEEVVLFSTIVPQVPGSSQRLPEDLFPLQAEVSWLSCRESCIPGSASLRLETGEPDVSRSGLVDLWRSKVPVASGSATVAVERFVLEEVNGDFRLRADLAGPDAETINGFFPLSPLEGLDLKGIEAAPGSLLLPLKGPDFPETVSGVLVTGSGAYRTEKIPVEISSDSSVPDDAGSLGAMLLLAFFGGMLLNIMPCVLPVLGLKVFSLIGPGGEDRAAGRFLSLVFAGGVLFSFWVLAAFIWGLQAMGAQVGWGFQFQSPAFVMFMAAVVFAFALNLFGVFEFSAPVVSGRLGRLASHHDSAGAFVSGVLATTLATPCTAPFLGTALGFAFAQPPGIIFLIFTVIAAGMAMPYVVLAWHPSWLKFLPRPGQWMYRFKQIMGFILVAVVVWLASILGSQGGSPAMLNLFVLLFAVSFVLWLTGLFTVPGTSTLRQALVWLITIGFLAGAYTLLSGRIGTISSDSRNSLESGRQTDGNGVVWLDYSPDVLDTLLKEEKSVLIDFTAEWCLTCKVLEASVLGNEDVGRALKRDGLVAVRADWTSRNDEITALLQRFGRSGIPLLVIIPQGRIDNAVVLPEVVTVDMLLDALSRVSGDSPSKLQGDM
ncbi:MAG: thiol:disulfide interchange protein [Prosthecochloris sp.]|uniref:protein-disulfide reductase DsbD family protein n=1 Tax=Prosthecochloris sp. TaxID=290513 RepID=UPI0013CC7D52|nr:thioredoxin family protein [Prosthecochloris sp.]NEX11460.1 thiol:disulfide interchange protein [Prosthecochloris sp.]